MLNVTRLLCGTSTPGDALRYGEKATSPHHIRAPSAHFRPIVVWNVTRRCNLRCLHCYTSSNEHPAKDELNHQEAQAVVEDLAAFKVPVILFSGGEPLIREDVFDLMAQTASLGVQPVVSTNGTLIDAAMTDRLKAAGVSRVGISIDGLEKTNDGFRQKEGAFRQAMDGIRASMEAGFRVSLRFTMTQYNVEELDQIFEMVEEMEIPRVCIYHVAYSGRGRRLLPMDLQHDERRDAVGRMFQHTMDMHSRGHEIEVLTVDNHTDGAYLLLWAQEQGHWQHRRARQHPSRPVLEGADPGQRSGSAFQRGLAGQRNSPAQPAAFSSRSSAPDVPGLQIPFGLQREPPRSRRGGHRRPLGRRPGMLPHR